MRYFLFGFVSFFLFLFLYICVFFFFSFLFLEGVDSPAFSFTRSFSGSFCARWTPPFDRCLPCFMAYGRAAAADGSFHANEEHAGWAKNKCAWVVQKTALSESRVDAVTSSDLVLCFHYTSKSTTRLNAKPCMCASLPSEACERVRSPRRQDAAVRLVNEAGSSLRKPRLRHQVCPLLFRLVHN